MTGVPDELDPESRRRPDRGTRPDRAPEPDRASDADRGPVGGSSAGSGRISDVDRERAAALLGTAMEQGRITPVEFTDRCAAAWAARTRAELLAPLADLPGGPPPGLEPLVLDVPFGQVRRTGEWVVPEVVRVVGIGQRTLLDFTGAVISHPVVTIEISASMSSTRIYPPADVELESDGLELVAGSIRHRRATPRRPQPGWGGLPGPGGHAAPGRDDGTARRGLRRLFPGGREPEQEPVVPVRFVLRGRATLSTVTLWHPRPTRRR